MSAPLPFLSLLALYIIVSKECISFHRDEIPQKILSTKSGVVHSETSERPYNRKVYAVFLTKLFRTLQLRVTPNEDIAMDNVGFHKCDEIKSLFSVNNYTVLYIPPYSPFLNPINEAFRKVKVIVRRSEPKNSELIHSIQN
ncbi:hypothetical protein RF11_11570 [Thelohanellus kitauei]|uniref:Tc1-like transposase DDE domain-containing protein n=1 Tax=Thelohanellus kitauei TaxID=669202 RepID=A0A0C2MDG4_THEKT|nr:hypothetical protein RF11_11570 [Thelohanellus kitauei]